METVLLSTNLTSIGSVCFSGCENLSSIVIPEKVSTINGTAFYGCKNLKTVTIGKSVTKIYSKAFAECKSLESVVCKAENAPSANSDAFENSYTEHVTLYVPENSVSKYRLQEPWSNFGQIKSFSGNLRFTLTYKVDGDVYKTYQLEAGAMITPEAIPTKDGYTFSGWSEIPATMPMNDVTVTGTFERQFDVGHLVNLINFIVARNATADDITLYDMNNDKELNIGDVILVVKSILERGGSANYAARSSVEVIDDLRQYTAIQFELKTGHTDVRNIRLVENLEQSHHLMYRQIDSETYDVVIYSLTNQLLNPESGDIILVETNRSATETMAIQNITAATPMGETDHYKGLPIATGIQQIKADESQKAIIYDINGRRIDGNIGQKNGLYIINGKKSIVK